MFRSFLWPVKLFSYIFSILSRFCAWTVNNWKLREQSCAWFTIEGLRDIKCDSRSLLTTRLKLFCYAYLLSISFEQFRILLFVCLRCLPVCDGRTGAWGGISLYLLKIHFNISPPEELRIDECQATNWFRDKSIHCTRRCRLHVACVSLPSMPTLNATAILNKKCIKRVWKGPKHIKVVNSVQPSIIKMLQGLLDASLSRHEDFCPYRA